MTPFRHFLRIVWEMGKLKLVHMTHGHEQRGRGGGRVQGGGEKMGQL